MPSRKKHLNKYAKSLLVLVLIVGLSYLIRLKGERTKPEENIDLKPRGVPSVSEGGSYRTSTTIIKVRDGDTVETNDGKVIRYIGVGAPEKYQFDGKGWRPIWECYSFEAEAKNKDLVQGQRVLLEAEREDKDRYGRLLRYVFVKKGKDLLLVNEHLIRQGYAKYYRVKGYTPKYARLLQEAEQEARLHKRGLWGACYKADGTERAIKGDIRESGEKRYFLPRCSLYGEVIIDTLSGEQWFSTEREARAAGWKRARECK